MWFAAMASAVEAPLVRAMLPRMVPPLHYVHADTTRYHTPHTTN